MKVVHLLERSARYFADRSALVARGRRGTIRELKPAALEKGVRR